MINFLHFLSCRKLQDNFEEIATTKTLYVTLLILFIVVIDNRFCAAQKYVYLPEYKYGHSLDTLDVWFAKDTLINNDTTSLDKIQQWAEKHKLMAEICSWFIRPKKSNSYCPPVEFFHYPDWEMHEGKIIGAVRVRTLDVFGATVNDTLQKANSWLEKVGNAVHVKTKEYVVRNRYLLFKEQDKLNPDVLRDSERILRGVNSIRDARIYVKTRPDSDTVDVEVITQDIWSLVPDARPTSPVSGWTELEERNLLGFGHTLAGRVSYNPDVPTPWEYHSRFESAFLGHSFVQLKGEWWDTYAHKAWTAGVDRQFLSPDMHWAGGITTGYRRWLATPIIPEDSLQKPFFYSYLLQDAWGAYAFPIRLRESTKGRSNIVVASRFTNYYFLNRPLVEQDTNQLYQNRTQMLWSVGVSTRNYYRDYLIYGFGRTEDIPIGQKAVFTFGKADTELGSRYYSGIEFSRGINGKRNSYLHTSLRFGTYFTAEAARMEQGVAEGELMYYSPLLCMGKWRMRQFLRSRYTKGIRRFDREYTDIDNRRGIWGLSSEELRGTEAALLGTETVFFTPWKWMDFQWAFFLRVDVGMTAFENQQMTDAIFQGYNIGFRIYNERLTFRTIQFRLGFYTGFESQPYFLRYVVEDVPRTRFQDFDIAQPSVIDFHRGNEGN